MRQFINDMIHMTEGERLVYYWPLWLGIIIFAVIFILVSNSKKRKR